MSCNCNNSNPCSQTYSTESVSSQLSNLTLLLFGVITKTVVNGRAVWDAPCGTDWELPGIPRTPDEGSICYINRCLESLGFTFGGIWDVGTTYSTGTFVSYNTYKWYRALSDTTGDQPDLSPLVWELVLSAPQGPPGPAGSAGSGTTASVATADVTAASVNLTDTDAVVLYAPTADSVVNLAEISTLAPGKWYEVRNDSNTFTVTITPFTGETINGAATYVIPAIQGTTVSIRSAVGSTDWRVC